MPSVPRDRDVFIGDLLAPVMWARADDKDMEVLHLCAEARRVAAYTKLRTDLAADSYERSLRRAGQ